MECSTANADVNFSGEFFVNDVPIVGWSKVPNGIIYALKDFLYTEHIEPHLNAIPRDYNSNNEENEIEDIFAAQPTTTTTTTTSTTTTTTATTTTEMPLDYTPSPRHQWISVEKCETVDKDTGSGIFKSIVVCVEELVDPAREMALKKLMATKEKKKEVRKEDDKLPVFLEEIVDVLGVLRFGSNEFLDYIQSANIRDAFNEGNSLNFQNAKMI